MMSIINTSIAVTRVPSPTRIHIVIKPFGIDIRS